MNRVCHYNLDAVCFSIVFPFFFHVCACVFVFVRGECVCVCVCVLCEVGYNFVCVRLCMKTKIVCVCVCVESLCMKNYAEIPLMKSLSRQTSSCQSLCKKCINLKLFWCIQILQVTALPVRRVNWTGDLPKLDITSLQKSHDPSSCLLPQPLAPHPSPPLPPNPAFPSPSPPTILFREKSSRLSWLSLGGWNVHGCHFFKIHKCFSFLSHCVLEYRCMTECRSNLLVGC